MQKFKRVVFLVMVTLCAFRALAQQRVPDAQHSVIYSQPGRFAGWPANNGAYLFDNGEILVGFTEAPYKKQKGHNAEKPYQSWLARSTDGGKKWSVANPEGFVGDFSEMPQLKTLDSPIDFRHPGFALRVVGASYHGADDGRGHFFYTYDKGKNWKGPFTFGDLLGWKEFAGTGLNELSPRTDYIVLNKNECLFFFSIRTSEKFASDRLFCIRTVDGGKSFHFQGWVVEPAGGRQHSGKVNLFTNPQQNPLENECRAVMSQSEKLSNGVLVSMIRRKYTTKDGREFHWIDAFESRDTGKTWRFLSKVADTGAENGNPPAFAVTVDGRLCVVYGERNKGTIRVIYSADQGKTWGEPQILMEGFYSEDMELNDLGYPRVIRRKDGKMVAIYYYSTRENLHHLRATTWRP